MLHAGATTCCYREGALRGAPGCIKRTRARALARKGQPPRATSATAPASAPAPASSPHASAGCGATSGPGARKALFPQTKNKAQLHLTTKWSWQRCKGGAARTQSKGRALRGEGKCTTMDSPVNWNPSMPCNDGAFCVGVSAMRRDGGRARRRTACHSARTSCCSASTAVIGFCAPAGGLRRRSECSAAPLQHQLRKCLPFAALQPAHGHCQLCIQTAQSAWSRPGYVCALETRLAEQH